ncbi:MAG: hypothetical protein ACE5G1_15920 [bacterium]
MKSSAVKAQNLVYRAAEPFLPNDTPGDQVYRAYRRLRAKQMPAGWSKVRRAYYGKAGDPTYLALKQQARLVRLPIEDNEHIARLRGLQELIYERHGDRDHPDIKALEEAIHQLSPHRR